MSEEVVKALIVALFGTGGATFIWTLVRSYLAWKNSAELREDKAIARLEDFERECREQLRCERVIGDYWRSWAGTLVYTLREHGVPLPEQPPLPLEDAQRRADLDMRHTGRWR